MKKNTKVEFLEILGTYFNSYLPIIKGLSPNTIKSYKYCFRLLLSFMKEKYSLSAEQITFDVLDSKHIYAFLDWLETDRNCSTSTRNQRLAALESFSLYAQNRSVNAATIFVPALKQTPIKRTGGKTLSVFTPEEISILLSLPDEHTKAGLRNKVMLSLMYATGCRAQEVCDLKVSSIRTSNQATTVTIIGKGSKIRRVGIPATCADILSRYIQFSSKDKSPDKPLFSSQTHEKMTISCVEEIFKKYIKQAKEQHPDKFRMNYSPHSIRHTTATHMVEAGVPLMVVKNFLGHESLQTTQIYLEISRNTVDKHLKDWDEKWFSRLKDDVHTEAKEDSMPDFLQLK